MTTTPGPPGHLALPLRLGTGGALAAHPDGTPGEIGQSVAVLLSTQVGERRTSPEYGSRGPEALLFADARSAGTADVAAVQAWEERATPQIVDVVAAALTSS